MDTTDARRTREIGQRPRHLERAVEAARGKAQLVGGGGEQLGSSFIGSCNPLQQTSIRLRVGADALALIARRLQLTGGRYTQCYGRGRFAWRRGD